MVDYEDDLNVLLSQKPDVVFLGMKRIPRKITSSDSHPFTWLSKFLDQHNIPYTGSAESAMVLDVDKASAKSLLAKSGLKTAPHFMAYTGQFTNVSQLPIPFPLFVKPPNLGGGKGIDENSLVRNFKDYKIKIKPLKDNNNSEALVESYLPGRDFTVSLLKKIDRPDKYIATLELVAPPNKNGFRILGEKVKQDNAEVYTLLEDSELKNDIEQLALSAFNELGARDYARIDLRLDEKVVPHFLEVNLIPSILEGYGSFQKTCELSFGMNYDDMLLHIVELALHRKNIVFAQED